jgi:hypothetical protein
MNIAFIIALSLTQKWVVRPVGRNGVGGGGLLPVKKAGGLGVVVGA